MESHTEGLVQDPGLLNPQASTPSRARHTTGVKCGVNERTSCPRTRDRVCLDFRTLAQHQHEWEVISGVWTAKLKAQENARRHIWGNQVEERVDTRRVMSGQGQEWKTEDGQLQSLRSSREEPGSGLSKGRKIRMDCPDGAGGESPEQRDVPCSWIRRLNNVKMSIVSKLM